MIKENKLREKEYFIVIVAEARADLHRVEIIEQRKTSLGGKYIPIGN